MLAQPPVSEPTTGIRLAFSPDSDDAFMFWPLLAGRVDTEGLRFEAQRADTETLNGLARAGQVDLVAISIARWPAISDRYQLLPHGMSVGRGYGPILVSERPRDLASLQGARIGVPGLRTTAYLVLRLILPDFQPVVIPITPYARAFAALRAHEIEAALLIHEGRLTFEREGFAPVCDLGEAWSRMCPGMPLPLGANAIRRALGSERIARVRRVVRGSIEWALAHRDEAIDALLGQEHRADVGLDRNLIDRYLAMYANSDSVDASDDVKRAIGVLYARAHEAGLIDLLPDVDFA